MHQDDGQEAETAPVPLTQELAVALLRHPAFNTGVDVTEEQDEKSLLAPVNQRDAVPMQPK